MPVLFDAVNKAKKTFSPQTVSLVVCALIVVALVQTMTTFKRQFGVVIVGGGPAGLAVLLAAHKDGTLTELLRQGLLIVEQSSHIGNGLIGSYAITSDSTGTTFVDPLRAGGEEALHRILETPVGRKIAAAGPNAIPLTEAGELLALVGQAFESIISRFPESAVMTSTTAEYARLQPDGSWLLAITDADGRKRSIEAEQVILATGAAQPPVRLEHEWVAGKPLMERWGDRLLQSGDVIGIGGAARVSALLAGKANPRVAIVGGSTSGMSVAYSLLNRVEGLQFGECGVTLFHRRPLRVYYTSVEEAIADGYTEFGPDDLCPITNRVFRFAGMRLDSRELLMRLFGIGGRPPEPRMKLHQLIEEDAEAVAFIDSADLVVAALGYRPNALRILNVDGAEIPLLAHTGPKAPMVDDCCRVMSSERSPIPGLYGIGLAAGFQPRGKLGGEPSFIGQANGLWLWQNDVGSIIVNAVLRSTAVSLAMPRRAPEAALKHLADRRAGHRTPLAFETGD